MISHRLMADSLGQGRVLLLWDVKDGQRIVGSVACWTWSHATLSSRHDISLAAVVFL